MSDANNALLIVKDSEVASLNVHNVLGIPVGTIASLGAPVKGELGYNIADNKIYYSNGTQWLPISIGGGSGNSSSFSLIKGSTVNIPSNTPVILGGWSITPQPPYHDQTGNWNLTTGIFTASIACTLTINACIAWAAGTSNLGYRTLNIFYQPNAGFPMIVKQVMTQANPSTNVETAQETSICILMSPGDTAWISAFQNSNVTLTISNSFTTTISGIVISV